MNLCMLDHRGIFTYVKAYTLLIITESLQTCILVRLCERIFLKFDVFIVGNITEGNLLQLFFPKFDFALKSCYEEVIKCNFFSFSTKKIFLSESDGYRIGTEQQVEMSDTLPIVSIC